MRILAGAAKGKILKTRDGKSTRPTDARAREMLFNILGARVLDANFLDLYAGSGSVGLEALSRGAQQCTFVEQNGVAARILRENLQACGWQDDAQVWQATVQSALRRLAGEPRRFDIIFADPPFIKTDELANLCRRLDEFAVTRPKTNELLVIQHHRHAQPQLARFRLLEARHAGESVFSFFNFILEPVLE